MDSIVLNMEMIVVMSILAFTMYLFISEVVRVDVAAILVMVLLGVISYVWPWIGDPGTQILDIKHLFDGFSSNAVISIIAVMIIGAGLDKSGIMGQVANKIMSVGGTTEKRIIPLISSTVGIISSFMQNVGAAALFLPVVNRISNTTGLPMSRLLMPMGFCAILGGTVTMIGSSPLILLNDLLPADMEGFNLFDVTPVGLALIATGVLYFVLLGRYVLPASSEQEDTLAKTMLHFKSTYGLEGQRIEVVVPKNSPLVGKTVSDLEALSNYEILILASLSGSHMRVSPAKDVKIQAGDALALLGEPATIESFGQNQQLHMRSELEVFAESLGQNKAGISELVIPPGSRLSNKSLMDLQMRKTYGLNVMAVFRGEQTIRQGFRELVLHAGDTLVVHSLWDDLSALEKNRDFAIITADYPHEELRPHKLNYALGFFFVAIALVLFTDMRLSVALLTGAVGMILSGVLTIDEAYEAVSWKTVFLLASLIPLGMAVEITGTAAWIAQETLNILGDVPAWMLQAAIAVLATFFTLVMSNVGATVLLVPLAVNIALGAGADPRIFALTVAIATSNSFLIPTHQVNALIMGPGGYRVKDFMLAGGGMTILFLIVSMIMMNLIF
ncbi:SLC13 family permease [Candidatus Venteria ishoeyi]|uniref:Potassium transporter peripheral membrane component n=1 Tax=Candidatus Venteria ishoeyi TaxID=1899563 RepID=A0A1H6F6P0_9GAMM|nr:SLC13 family permease [Candidatus Venteria ishoeyi]MDM8544916.1 SLC13 family permease [Candidatus Venteria ishoeyi]SEH05810.1 potassium transporter peripheral membrane component [Candidatus Venteria ishoeyi]